MSAGVDLSCVEDVVVVDDPEDIDDLFQKYATLVATRNVLQMLEESCI